MRRLVVKCMFCERDYMPRESNPHACGQQADQCRCEVDLPQCEAVRYHAQVDQRRSHKHVEALHLRIKEYRDELALAKKDAKCAAKALKHAEVSLAPWPINCHIRSKAGDTSRKWLAAIQAGRLVLWPAQTCFDVDHHRPARSWR